MREEGFDLRGYWLVFRRRWWLFVLGLVVGPAVVIATSEEPLPSYTAAVRILVEGRPGGGVPSANDIITSQYLAASYTDLIKTRPLLTQVVQELALPYDADSLGGKISVKNPRSLIEIKATDGDPVLAAAIANTLARKFIEDQQERQLTQIAEYQAAAARYGIPQESAAIAAQLFALKNLSILEEAVPPTSPSNPSSRTRDVFLAGLGGLALAVLATYVLEQLDDSVKTPDEVKELTGLTPVGAVPKYGGRNGLRPLTLEDTDQQSTLAESFKFVRTNLEFLELGNGDVKTLEVTSAQPTEGKTTVAANLAISFARVGKSTILVDSDLRAPAMRRVFEIESREGLVDVLMGRVPLEQALVPTSVEGLRVLCSGASHPDPTAVLRSPRMKALVSDLKSRADVVIFDSPPLLVVADPLLLASLVDGVLVVADQNRTRREQLKLATASVQQANPRISGFVMNKATSGGRGGYYYYHYYYGRYSRYYKKYERPDIGSPNANGSRLRRNRTRRGFLRRLASGGLRWIRNGSSGR